MTALHFACSNFIGFPDYVKILHAHGASITDRSNDGRTAFLHACNTYGHETIKYLFENANADVNDVDNENNTCLHLISYSVASDCLNDEYIRHICENGGQKLLSFQNSEGDTPLHCATYSDNLIAAKIMIEFGANIYTKNNNGETPLDVYNRRTEILISMSQRNGVFADGDEGLTATLKPLQLLVEQEFFENGPKSKDRKKELFDFYSMVQETKMTIQDTSSCFEDDSCQESVMV